MNNAIGGANLTFTVPLSGNSSPTQSFSPLGSGGGDFMSQLAAAITNALFSGQQGAQGSQGNQGGQSNFGGGNGGGGFGGGSPVGGGAQQGGGSLQQLLAEVMQDMGITPQNSPFNAQAGQGNANAFSQGMQSGLSGPSQNGGGGFGATGGPGGFGGPGLAMPSQQSSFSPSSLQGPGNYQQLGNQMGGAVANKAGIQSLDDMTSKTGFPGMSKIEGGSKETAKEMGKFMDQYPDIFGKPQAGKLAGLVGGGKHDSSWEDALSNGGLLNDDSVKKFEQAKGMMKSVMEGDMGNPNLQLRGIGGSSVGMDASMTADNINKAALNQLT